MRVITLTVQRAMLVTLILKSLIIRLEHDVTLAIEWFES